MKIVFVSHNAYLQGGAQGVLLDLVKGIKKIYPHYLVYVIFPEQGTLIDAFLPYVDGYTTIKQPCWMVDPKKKSLYKSVLWITRFVRYALKTLAYLRQLSPDVVMTNTIASPVAALACKWGGYKHLWFIHEVPVDSGSYAFLYPEKKIVRWVERLSFKVFAVSDHVLNHYKSLMKNREKIHRIHYSVEVNVDAYFERKVSCYTLLLVGYFNDNKGQKEAIEACRVFNRKSSIPFRLLLVGAGDDDYSNEIREQIKNDVLNNCIELINFTTEIHTYYQQADVLLMCSASEGLPKVVVEAQKYGLPVIATSIAANKELIEEGNNGLFYQRGNIEQLSCAIDKMSDSSLRESMGENAFRFMVQRYTTEQFVKEFVAEIQ